MAIGAIYIHMSTKSLLAPPVLYLSTAVLIQTSLSTIWFGHILYRNVRFGKPLNTVSIRAITFKRQYENDIPVLDAVHVHVRLTKPWKPQAGQYVYLCIPGLTLTSFAQLHPFYVSWWYRDSNGNEYIVLLVQRYTGFTKDLLLHMGNEPGYKPKLKAVIEGPYGRELALDQYGTVLLFSTGIGITGQLLYVARLLEGYRKCEVKTRRIALFWEVQSECKLKL
jgi:predicted ferric reductase